MASLRAELVSRGPGVSKDNLIITVQRRICQEIGALQSVDGMFPRYASV